MDLKYIFDTSIKVSANAIQHNNYTWQGDIFERDVVEYFYSMVKEVRGATVVDIGAQSGLFTLMAKLLPETSWYAFEAEPKNFKLLCDNIELNDITNVKTFNVGVLDSVGTLAIKTCNSHSGLHTFGHSVNRFSEADSKSVEVATTTLDTMFENIKIDFIKIDTEGAEHAILKGGCQVIQRWKPTILMEYEDRNLQQFGKTLHDLKELITTMGYRIEREMGGNVIIKPCM